MKALLAIASERVARTVSYYIRPLGFDIILYSNPLKAMDNIDEIAPEAVIVSAEDFPRHWKPFIQLVRDARPKDECVFILLKGEHFGYEEAAKAMHLGVNGVIREDFRDRSELDRLNQLLKRYLADETAGVKNRFIPGDRDRLSFAFSHPKTFRVVTGKIESISPYALAFRPGNPEWIADIGAGAELSEASLRIGDRILSFSCKVTRVSGAMGIELSGASEADRTVIHDYLVSYAERSLARETSA